MKKKKVSVLMDITEYEKLEEFCRVQGHKKSTLISKLVRDFLVLQQRKAEEGRLGGRSTNAP